VKRSAYDAVVLGAGPSGLTAAYCLAREGANDLIDRRYAFGS
jgi:flavin-dependent dehydrogenase